MTDVLKPIRQAQYLEAMGIQRWVRRDSSALSSLPHSQRITEARITEAVTSSLSESPLSISDLNTSSSSNTPIPSIIPTPVATIATLDWSALSQQVAACTACELHQTRTQTVFGTGNQQAEWLFIGEAPGEDEDTQGIPFVGPVGQLLNAMLYAMGLTREQVYITNVVKCRPPNNRSPDIAEMTYCQSFLQRQIALIRPRLIVALGSVAARQLLATTTPITNLRGQRFEYEGIPLIATYHPAYLLRRPTEKRKSWQDLKFMLHTVAQLPPRLATDYG